MVVGEENGTTGPPDPYAGLSVLDIKRLNYPLWAHQIAGAFLLIVSMTGIVLNSIVLYTFKRNKQLRSPTNIFIIGLTTSTLVHAAVGNTLSWISALNGTWVTGPLGCTITAYIFFVFGLSSLYQLSAISIDRYIVICKPLLAPKITKRVAILCVICCYIGGFTWATLPFTGWASYGLETPGITCGIDREDRTTKTLTYMVCVFLFVFAMPLCVMIYCYHGVYSTVRQVSKMSAFDKNSRIAKKNIKVEKKMLKTCIAMCVGFFAAYGPYACVLFYGAFINYETIPIFLTAVPAFIMKSEVVWNPIIYVGTNKVFRREFYASIPCAGIRESLMKSEEEQKEQESKDTDDEEEKEKEKEKEKDAEQGGNENKGNPNSVAPVA